VLPAIPHVTCSGRAGEPPTLSRLRHRDPPKYDADEHIPETPETARVIYIWQGARVRLFS